MSKYTENYKLILPEQSENYDVDIANTNNKEIDTQLGNKVDKIAGKGLSTNDFTNEYKNKLDRLKNYDDSLLQTEIEKLKTEDKNFKQEQKEQNTNIDKLKEENKQLKDYIDNITKALPNGKAEGKNIHLEDSAEAELLDIKAYGESEQETSEQSDNLLDVSKVPDTSNIIKIKNGLKVTNYGCSIPLTEFPLRFKIGETYYAKATFTKINEGSGSAYATGHIVLRNSSNALYLTQGPITIPDNFVESDYSIFFYGCGEGECTFTDIIISKKDVDYVPFTPNKPSLEFPSKIENIGDNINCFNVNGDFEQGYKNFYARETLTGGNLLSTIFSHKAANEACKLYYKMRKNEKIHIKIFDSLFKFALGVYADLDGTIRGSLTSVNPQELTYTAPEDCLICGIIIKKGGTDYTDEEIETLKNSIKIEQGTEATSWSPYGCGNMNINICNRNFLKLVEIKETVLEGITYSVTEQKLKLNGTSTEKKYPWIVFTKNGIYTKFGTPTASEIKSWANGIILTGPATRSINVFSGQSTENVSIVLFDENGETVTNTSEGKNIVAVGLYLGTSPIFSNYVIGVQLEKGNTITSYEKHEEQTATFTFAEGQVLHKDDYLADDGIHYVRATKKIDGKTGEWIYYSASTDWARPYILITDKKLGEDNATNNVLSDKYISSNWNDCCNATIKKEAVFTYSGDSRIEFLIPKSKLETQDKAGVIKYFNENPTNVEYNLEKEVIVPYTEQQQEEWNNIKRLMTYKNVTNIYSDANLKIVYLKDLNKILQP